MSMDQNNAINLAQLNSKIKTSLRTEFIDAVWVTAEINQFNQHSSGHCYLELIEKDGATDTILASVRATIWASAYSRISAFFKTSTGQSLSVGIKVLIKVQVDFHEVYGLSLNIRDIDPNYTIGDMARKRAEVIRKLELAGVIDMNKELELTRVPQKIAIISSPSAAGFEDFCQQLDHNPSGYIFYWKLYSASMQGSETGQSIISALDRISENADFFDAVVIIRGGGSKTDLSAFDDFDLAYYITQFPLPIITGIGHERDESVADLVAHTVCKTPTAVAEYLIDLTEHFESELDWMKESITRQAKDILNRHRALIGQHTKSLEIYVRHFKEDKKTHLKEKVLRSESASKAYLANLNKPLQRIQDTILKNVDLFLLNKSTQQHKLFKSFHSSLTGHLSKNLHKLELIEKQCEYLDPYEILKRGYSISSLNGKPIKDASLLNKGDRVVTKVSKGSFTSTLD